MEIIKAIRFEKNSRKDLQDGGRIIAENFHFTVEVELLKGTVVSPLSCVWWRKLRAEVLEFDSRKFGDEFMIRIRTLIAEILA